MAERGREAGPNPKRSLKSVLRQLFFGRPPTPTPEPARKARNQLLQKTKPAQNYQSIQEYRQDAGLDGSQVAAPVVRSSEAYTQPRRARENTLDDLFDERPNYEKRVPKVPGPESEKPRKIIVGIDFGTTFSGVAWAETRRPDVQSIIESWPADLGTHEGITSPKVPTELRDTPQGLEWGFQIPPLLERNYWFKLGLAEDHEAEGILKPGPTPEELTTSFLTNLNDHFVYTLGEKLGASILRTTPLQICVTVPAIWSEKAKERTLRACQRAGFGTQSEILLISEPEAAATCALHGLDPHGLQVGDTFVVCDAGGGTVDLISYTITELSPKLKVKEAAPGTGDLCGSAFLNKRFGQFLEEKLGQEPGWDEEVLAEAIDRFETIVKRQHSLSARNSASYKIPVSGLPNNVRLGVQKNRLNLSPDDVESILDPVVDKVIDLVRDQIIATKQSVNAVLLVGGFGQSNYLKERMRESLEEEFGVRILQPPNAWTVVVRGAVMMGLARYDSSSSKLNVISRAARKHYATEVHVTYDPSIHSAQAGRKFWRDINQEDRVWVLGYFIRKGDAVEENKPKRIEFILDHFLVGEPLGGVMSMEIWCDEVSASAPLHKTAKGRTLVTLTADFSRISPSDIAAFPTELRPDGNTYYVISAAIEATFYSASTKYVLNCGGRRYDSVTAEYV